MGTRGDGQIEKSLPMALSRRLSSEVSWQSIIRIPLVVVDVFILGRMLWMVYTGKPSATFLSSGSSNNNSHGKEGNAN